MDITAKLKLLRQQITQLEQEFRSFIADEENIPLDVRWRTYCENQDLLDFGDYGDCAYEPEITAILKIVKEDFAGQICWHSDLNIHRYQKVKYKDIIEFLEMYNWDATEKCILSQEVADLIVEMKESLLLDANGGFTYDW
ncbi:hypothetical protein vBValSX1_95 [Vibrio phage vB_ValS_X1]|uniref:Uncharacterized protein n=1 Tax=Vibrio phage vB_ValS_X1 TaxID=2736341 RepID=A0A6M9Z6R0_9CAUD|nr:hypothetical protein vBValSX1_95 [Vibrio phage vB_ValS_X1]